MFGLLNKLVKIIKFSCMMQELLDRVKKTTIVVLLIFFAALAIRIISWQPRKYHGRFSISQELNFCLYALIQRTVFSFLERRKIRMEEKLQRLQKIRVRAKIAEIVAKKMFADYFIWRYGINCQLKHLGQQDNNIKGQDQRGKQPGHHGGYCSVIFLFS